MPVERPTFSESWYRVADLRPRLLPAVWVRRQHFRGQTWYVLQDPANNEFFRLSEPAWHLIGLLDGRRTVAEAWRLCNEAAGDAAPTQGETIQVLGQLYVSNLLRSDLPPETRSLFARYRRRRMREVQGFLSSLLFVRLPVLDPDRFLDRWVGLLGRLFTWYGLAAWMVLLGAGLYSCIGRFGELAQRAGGVLAPENLPLLYLALVVVKVLHEFGHAFACKRSGQVEGAGGEVHVMGVMMLVFAPLPYLDASGAWAFRSKWRRILVGASGMMVELAVASVAAIIWAQAAPGALRALCYNVMFTASVGTVLFNGNPLLRYDAYYMLSDLLEIPNLAQRSRLYLYYLVRRYVYGVRRPQSPAHTPGERAWLAFYAVASTVYRAFICVAILLFVADRLFVVGMVLAIAAAVAWVAVPLARFARYLATSGELARTRGRAVATTLAALGLILAAVGAVSAPDRCRLEGVVEPARLAVVYAKSDGFLRRILPSGSNVAPDGPDLVAAENLDLTSRRAQLSAERNRLDALRRLYQTQELALAEATGRQLAALDQRARWVDRQIADLRPRSPLPGEWLSLRAEDTLGAFVQRGAPLGMVASTDEVIIRAVAGQDVAARLVAEGRTEVEIRVRGRPEQQCRGRIIRILPAGQEQLPSAALGYAAGGTVQTDVEDRAGFRTIERFFEVHIAPEPGSGFRLLSGQRVAVRASLSHRPLAGQWWRSLLQLVQRRFHV